MPEPCPHCRSTLTRQYRNVIETGSTAVNPAKLARFAGRRMKSNVTNPEFARPFLCQSCQGFFMLCPSCDHKWGLRSKPEPEAHVFCPNCEARIAIEWLI